MKIHARGLDGARPGFAVLVVLLAGLGVFPARAADGTGIPSNLSLLERLTRSAAAEAVDSLALEPGTPVTVLSRTWHEGNWFVGNVLARVLAERGHPVQVLDVAGPPAEGEAGSGNAAPTGGTKAGSPAGGNPDGPGAGTGGTGGSAAGTEGSAGTGDTPSGDPDEDDGLIGADSDTTGAYADSVAAANADPLWGDDSEEEATPVDPVPAIRRPSGVGLPLRSLGPGELPAGDVLDLRLVEFGVQYADARRNLLLGPLRFTRVGGVYLQLAHVRGPSGEVLDVVSSESHHVDRLSGSDRMLAEGASYPFSPPALQQPSLGRYIEPAVVVAIVGSLVYLFYSNQN